MAPNLLEFLILAYPPSIYLACSGSTVRLLLGIVVVKDRRLETQRTSWGPGPVGKAVERDALSWAGKCSGQL